MEFLKKYGAYAAIVAFFLVLSYALVPQVLGGKIVNQSDINSYRGMSHEADVWNEAHPDDRTQWTGSMFSGMPTVGFMEDSTGDATYPIYKTLLAGRRPATYFFIALLGAFLLLLSMGVEKFLAVAGAVAISLCAFNFQIIQVGHNTKMQAIAFFPWVLAAVIYTYRSISSEKWLLRTGFASLLFGLALSMQIKANHPQITYYLAIVILLYAITLFVWMLLDGERRRELGKFFAASGLLLVMGLVGIGTNAGKLLPTYEYGRYTMRGGSELSSEHQGREVNNDGLDIAYATAWSYGIGETPNLLIPAFNGDGSSTALSESSETAKLLKRYGYKGRELKNALEHMPTYWGPQPFTVGPMYIGAISIFLFLLGMLLYKGKEKWWLLAATLVAVFLAWGNHFMPWTEFWFYHMPMYSKFRSVSMALSVLQVTVPLLGFVVVDRILKNDYPDEEFRRKSVIAAAVTGGFCLLVALIPSIAGDFTSPSDQEALADVLAADRESMLRADALRSLLFILAAWAVVYYGYIRRDDFSSKKISPVAIALCVLVLFDLVGVGRRYLNSSHFVTPKENMAQYNPRPADKLILEDTDPSYRVLDMSVNTFNDAHQSYHHKCIGGYSPVKMQRYQDLIERYLTSEMQVLAHSLSGVQTIAQAQDRLPLLPVLSALNCRYIILDGRNAPLFNYNAAGPCWFAEDVLNVGTPDDELDALALVDLEKTAVFGSDFTPGEFSAKGSDSDFIVLIDYAPNQLTYSYSCSAPRLAVFSEVFYPESWTLKTDKGEMIPVQRCDWILRSAVIPAGEGTLTMRFEMPAVKKGRTISAVCSWLLILLCLGSCVTMPNRRRIFFRRSQE